MEFTSEGIILKPGQLQYKQYSGAKATYSNLAPTKMFGCLWDYIAEIDDNFTLKDLFQLVKEGGVGVWEEILQLPLKEFVEEGLTPPPEPIEDDLLHLEVQKQLYVENGELQDFYDFFGWGEYAADMYGGIPPEEMPCQGRYGLGFAPCYEIAHLPLKFNPEVKIQIEPFNNKSPVEYTCNQNIKLVDFLRVIFWELSFYGSPKERNKLGTELEVDLEKIDSGKENCEVFDSVEDFLDSIDRMLGVVQ